MPRRIRGTHLLITGLVVATSCVPHNRTQPRAALHSPLPSPAGWRLIARPDAFLAHAMIVRDGAVMLAGESTSPTPAGAVVRVDPATGDTGTIARFPEALHVRAIASDGASLWIGGDTPDGRGVLLRSDDDEQRWTRVALPKDVTDVEAIAASRRLVVTVRNGDDASILEIAPALRVLYRLRATRAPARLRALALAGERVVAAGTDGTRAVVVDDGRVLSPPAMREATGLTLDGASLAVCGYRDERGRTAVVARLAGRTWTSSSPPRALSATAITRGAHGVLVAAQTEASDVLMASRAGVAAWATTSMPDPPASLETVAISGSLVYAAGPSGLYAGPD